MKQIVCLAFLAGVICGPALAQLRPQLRPDRTVVDNTVADDTVVDSAVAAPATVIALSTTLSPQADPGAGPGTGPVLGPETNLPLPRFVSLKTDEGNVRRGPSLSHRIDWVFRREDLPLQIVAEYGHWRRVVDSDGVGGWMNYAMLSGNRTVLVQTDMVPILNRPDPGAAQNALLEQGVVAQLGECQPDWCWISAGGYRGWAPKSALWGVDAAEVRD